MTSSPKQRKKKLREKQAKRQARLTERRLEQFSPLQTVRMSEVIGHLAEPIVEEMVDSIETHEWVLGAAVRAWNLAILPPNEQDHHFTQIVNKNFGHDPETTAEFRWICDVIAERRQRFYPHLTRPIMDYHIQRVSPTKVHLSVVSGIDMSELRGNLWNF